MSDTGTPDFGGGENPWETIKDNRDLLERIVENEEPFEPEARKLLAALDRRGDD